MEINKFVPNMELRQFLVLVIPGMIFSFIILYPIDKLSCYKLLPADFTTSVNLPYVSLLIFYLLTSGLVFGVIFHFLYLWRIQRFIYYFLYHFFQSSIFLWFFSSSPSIKIESTDKFQKCPREFSEILLKSVNINISYKQVYRTFFGSLFISTFLSFLVLLLLLLFSFFQVSFFILFIMSILIVVFIASYFFAKKLTGEVDSADKELVGQLNKFLGDVKDNFPEEVYKNLFKK